MYLTFEFKTLRTNNILCKLLYDIYVVLNNSNKRSLPEKGIGQIYRRHNFIQKSVFYLLCSTFVTGATECRILKTPSGISLVIEYTLVMYNTY